MKNTFAVSPASRTERVSLYSFSKTSSDAMAKPKGDCKTEAGLAQGEPKNEKLIYLLLFIAVLSGRAWAQSSQESLKAYVPDLPEVRAKFWGIAIQKWDMRSRVSVKAFT